MTNEQYWSATEGVFNCLIDEERTLAFAAAIQNTVCPGDIVVDMGTGSGVLAMLAATAGAKRVYAVESDERNLRTLEATIAANGLADSIRIIAGDVTEIELPEPVDVIIGEMVATGLIEESHIPAMRNMIRQAKPGARVCLQGMENYADLVWNPGEYYGFRFDIMRYEYPGEPQLASVPCTEKHLYWSVNFSDSNSLNEEVAVNFTLPVVRGGRSTACA